MPCRVGQVNDILLHIVMCVSEDGVETWSSASFLRHYPRPDIICRSGALVPVCSDSVYSPFIEQEEGLW